MEEILKDLEENLRISGCKVTKYNSNVNELNPNETQLQIATRGAGGWLFKRNQYLRRNGYIYNKDNKYFLSKKKKRIAYSSNKDLILNSATTSKFITKISFDGYYGGKINWIHSNK